MNDIPSLGQRIRVKPGKMPKEEPITLEGSGTFA